MKIRTRIATAATAVIAAFATVLFGAPAFASEGERIDTLHEISSAGEPVSVIAISITGVIVLAVVLVLSTWVGNLFEKKA